jgi:hypothetical protein
MVAILLMKHSYCQQLSLMMLWLCFVTSICYTDQYLLTYSMEQSPSVKKFLAFHGTWRFITKFTSAHHLSLSRASSTPSTTPHPTSWRSILIFSSHLCLGLPGAHFPQVSPTKSYISLASLPYTLHAPHISFFAILSPEQYWVRSTDH